MESRIQNNIMHIKNKKIWNLASCNWNGVSVGSITDDLLIMCDDILLTFF